MRAAWKELTTPDRAMLLTLMALGGAASDLQLAEQFGETLDAERQRRLVGGV